MKKDNNNKKGKRNNPRSHCQRLWSEDNDPEDDGGPADEGPEDDDPEDDGTGPTPG